MIRLLFCLFFLFADDGIPPNAMDLRLFSVVRGEYDTFSGSRVNPTIHYGSVLDQQFDIGLRVGGEASPVVNISHFVKKDGWRRLFGISTGAKFTVSCDTRFNYEGRCLPDVDVSKFNPNFPNAFGHGMGNLTIWNDERTAFKVQCSLSYNIGFASFMEGGFDQPNADRAQSHADKGGNAHYFRPPRRDILGGKFMLFALAFACGFISLGRAIWLSETGKGEAALFYICVGVALVFYGGVGSRMAIG